MVLGTNTQHLTLITHFILLRDQQNRKVSDIIFFNLPEQTIASI